MAAASAERRYSKESASVSIAIVSDSPMLQATMMLFTNPMFATADGGKLEPSMVRRPLSSTVRKTKAAIQVVVNNRFLVTVNGSEVAKEDMTAYLAGVDVNKLSTLK